jgi:hypothetical protein
MVGRLSVASLDRGAESPVYGTEPSASADRVGPVAKPPWAGGGGGRWVPWPTRAALWTTVVFNETSANGDGSANGVSTSALGFPVALGDAFAERSGEAYLNYSPSTATQRAQELAAFISARAQASNLQFSWNGSEASVAQSTEVAGIDASSSGAAVITQLSTVNGKPIEVGVPLSAANAGLVVSAEPALLPAPPVATLTSAQPVSSDRGATSELTSQLPGFFEAFASGDRAALSRYLAPGASIGGLGGAVSFGGITSLQVPQGGSTRDLTVTVNWMLPGHVNAGAPRLATSYDMSVVDRQSGRWYVEDIRASTQPMGSQ